MVSSLSIFFSFILIQLIDRVNWYSFSYSPKVLENLNKEEKKPLRY